MQRGERWVGVGTGLVLAALVGALVQVDAWPDLPSTWLAVLGLVGLALGLVGVMRGVRP